MVKKMVTKNSAPGKAEKNQTPAVGNDGNKAALILHNLFGTHLSVITGKFKGYEAVRIQQEL